MDGGANGMEGCGVTNEELIARTKVFADSEEIAASTRDSLRDVDLYMSGEAYVHIIGLWEHTQELTAALAKATRSGEGA